jgi:hypothetical protein
MKYNPYKVLIYSCWGLLIVAFVVQLLGADWFTVGTDSEAFIKLCNFIDSKLWLRQICTCIISTTLSTFSILAILKQKWFTIVQFFIFIPLLVFTAYVNYYNSTVALILNFVAYLAIPIILNYRKWYRAFIGVALIYAFQAVSLLVKMVGGISLHNVSFLVGALLQIDSLLMVLLYYLYSIRKEKL